MKRSAASSRSAVVTPGWHLERSMRRQRAWMAPDAAMCSICSGVFLMIIVAGPSQGTSELLFHLEGGEHGPNSVVDVVGLPRTVDAAKDPVLLVVGDHRLGLLMVGGKPLANDLGLVIVPNLEPSAADVADVVVLRWIELDVEDVTLLDAGAAAAEAADHLVVGDVDQDRHGDPAGKLGHLRIERLGLGRRPREAVEDEAVARLAARHSLGDQADHDFVGDEVAPIHVVLRLAAQLGAVPDRGAKDVPGRVVGQAEVLLETLSLGSLARSRWAKQDEIQLRHGARA